MQSTQIRDFPAYTQSYIPEMDILVKVCWSHGVLSKQCEKTLISVDLNSNENISENIYLSFIVLNKTDQ